MKIYIKKGVNMEAAYESGRKGGSRKVKKGLSMLSPERRREIAIMGNKAGGRNRPKKPKNLFDVAH